MTNSKAIDLEWGGGSFSVIVDWRNGAIIPYSNQEEARRIHDSFGGKNYYISKTGLTGAGWVPNHAIVTKVSTYRVDVVNIDVPPRESWQSSICVPINYAEKKIDYNYPILVGRDCYTTSAIFCDSNSYHKVIMGEIAPQEGSIALSIVRKVGGYVENLTYPVYIAGKPRNFRKVFCSVKDFRFKWPQAHIESCFWNRLGLYKFSEDIYHVYKISSGICWAKAAVPLTIEEIISLAPKNVYFLGADHYLQRNGEYFEAVGRRLIDREEYSHEMSISFQDALRAMYGKRETVEKIKREVDDGCWKKYEVDDRRKKLIEGQILYQQERFKDYMDVVVSLQDSVDAGNCEIGTLNFLNKHFSGKEAVTVRELMPYVLDRGVKRAIEHVVIRQQKEQNEQLIEQEVE